MRVSNPRLSSTYRTYPQLLDKLSTKPFDAISRGVVNAVEYFNTPRKTLCAWATNPLLTKTVEAKVPKFKSLLVPTLAKCIQFRMHLIEKISIFTGKRMGLHLIRAHGNNATLMKYHAAMSLGAVNSQTDLLSQFVQIARTLNQSFIAVCHSINSSGVIFSMVS